MTDDVVWHGFLQGYTAEQVEQVKASPQMQEIVKMSVVTHQRLMVHSLRNFFIVAQKRKERGAFFEKERVNIFLPEMGRLHERLEGASKVFPGLFDKKFSDYQKNIKSKIDFLRQHIDLLTSERIKDFTGNDLSLEAIESWQKEYLVYFNSLQATIAAPQKEFIQAQIKKISLVSNSFIWVIQTTNPGDYFYYQPLFHSVQDKPVVLKPANANGSKKGERAAFWTLMTIGYVGCVATLTVLAVKKLSTIKSFFKNKVGKSFVRTTALGKEKMAVKG